MSQMGQTRRSDCAPITSGLPPINRHSQSPSACLERADTRHPMLKSGTPPNQSPTCHHRIAEARTSLAGICSVHRNPSGARSVATVALSARVTI